LVRELAGLSISNNNKHEKGSNKLEHFQYMNNNKHQRASSGGMEKERGGGVFDGAGLAKNGSNVLALYGWICTRVSLYRQPNLFWCLYIIYSYINTRVYHIDVFDDLGEIILSEGVFWGALLLLTFG
jgi:hypothetical protein